jgi:hypothetical protein
MGHAPELIQTIAELLHGQYPPTECEYILERAIPGTRMSPDILVRRDNEILCAVEIGYTRPEKLTAYRRDLKIPDVRWYDKSGVLHGDVEERVVSVKVEVVKQRPSILYGYRIAGTIDCKHCAEELDAAAGEIDEEDRQRQSEELACEVETLVLTDTDYCMAYLPSWCDLCGFYFFAEESAEDINGVEGVLDTLRGRPRDIAEQWEGRTELTWDEATRLVSREFELDLNACEPEFVHAEDGGQIRQAVLSISAQASLNGRG